MKKIFVVLVVILVGCTSVDETTDIKADSTLMITRTNTGFNIYSNTGELMLEFTELNCDSASLETLDLIYETAKEFYEQSPHQEEQKSVAPSVALLDIISK